jgi:hypothetical protein
MKKLLFIMLIAFTSCTKDNDTTIVSTEPMVTVNSYGRIYSGSNPQLYMDLTMSNTNEVSKVYLVTSSITYPIKIKNAVQKTYYPQYGNVNSLTGVWRFEMKNGTEKFSRSFNIQY